jgi:hypothetical protein
MTRLKHISEDVFFLNKKEKIKLKCSSKKKVPFQFKNFRGKECTETERKTNSFKFP